MKKHTSEYSSQEIKAQQEESHTEKNSPYFRSYESWITLLGAWEAHLYGILVNRSQRLSFTYIRGSSLLKTLGVSQATLTRLLSTLEKKGAIYRYVRPQPGGGKKRIIIPFQMAHKYWSKYLKNSPKDLKFPDFKLFMTQKRDPKSLIINATSECSPVSIRECSAVSIRECSAVSSRSYKDKKIKKEKNILLHTSSLPESDLESSEEEENFQKFERELGERGFSAEQIEVGRKFYAAFGEEVKSKHSPLAFLIKSLTSGIGADRLQGLEASQASEEAKASSPRDIEQNRALAERVVEKLSTLPLGYRVVLSHNCVHFSWPGSSSVVSLGDENFSQTLEAHVRKIETLSRSAGEASCVGEGEAGREQILRFAAKTEKDSPNRSSNGPRKLSKGVRSAQNDSRVSYAPSGLKVPQSPFKSVWATAPPNP